jgi:hypothetical protein
MTDNERRVALLCWNIRRLAGDIDGAEPALVELLGGNVTTQNAEVVERLEQDQGVAGHAWALHGVIEGGSWSDVVRAAGADAELSVTRRTPANGFSGSRVAGAVFTSGTGSGSRPRPGSDRLLSGSAR